MDITLIKVFVGRYKNKNQGKGILDFEIKFSGLLLMIFVNYLESTKIYTYESTQTVILFYL